MLDQHDPHLPLKDATIVAGISALDGRQQDKVCHTGSTSAEPSRQQLSLQEPGLHVHPASTVCTGQAQHKDVQALQVHQQESADASFARDGSTVCQAATALLHGAQAAGVQL